MPDKEELVCWITFVKQELSGIEAMIHRTACQEMPVLLRESHEKWMFTQNTLKVPH